MAPAQIMTIIGLVVLLLILAAAYLALIIIFHSMNAIPRTHIMRDCLWRIDPQKQGCRLKPTYSTECTASYARIARNHINLDTLSIDL